MQCYPVKGIESKRTKRKLKENILYLAPPCAWVSECFNNEAVSFFKHLPIFDSNAPRHVAASHIPTYNT